MFESKKMKQLGTITRLFCGFMAFGVNAHASTESVTPIIGGTSVAAGTTIAKRTVGLYFIQKDGRQGLCTGSLLDDSHVLTAAHCIDGFKQGLVIFSATHMLDIVEKAATKGMAAAPEARLVTSAVAQPGYDGQAGGDAEFNDVAILTFKGGMVEGYEPAKFLSKTDALNLLKKNVTVTLAGYGITSRPTQSPDPSDPDQGSGTLRQVNLKFNSMSPKNLNVFVQGRPGHDACSGDSGGPAMIKVSGETYVIGVASRSDCVQMSIYTLVHTANAYTTKPNQFFAGFFN